MKRRFLWMALLGGLGIALIVLLFVSMSVPIEALVDTLAQLPAWLIVAVVALTLANQLIGVVKWRIAAKWQSDSAQTLGFWRKLEITTSGSFFGLFIPLQLSMPLTRWLASGPELRQSGYAVRATFFEQVYDLLFLLGSGLAGITILAFGLPAPVSLVLFAVTILLCLIGLRPLSLLGARAAAWSARAFPAAQSVLNDAETGFTRAAQTTARVTALLCFWSLLRIVLLALRVAVMALVMAPGANLWLVAIGSPAVGLVAVIPLTPAGLGFAEWSWAAILLVAGAAAETAVIAGLGFRLVTMLALFILIGAFLVTRLVKAVRPA